MKINTYTKIICFLFVLHNFIVSILIGQNLQNLGLADKDKILRLPESFVVENQINPETYILGPGDKIGLSIITNSNMAYILTITPMGNLWIPDMGAIHLSGMNLNSAKTKESKLLI